MKKYTLVYFPGSLQDIEDAVDYYNQQQGGLGNRFILDVEKTIASIKRNPFFASVKYDRVRCAGLRKFPFSVHYIIDEENFCVIITAVFNTWREPFW